MFNPEVPYDIPTLPIDGRETIELLKKVTPSARALAALNQVARLLTKQNLLVNLNPILESKSNSEMNNRRLRRKSKELNLFHCCQ